MEELEIKEIFNMFWKRKIAIIVILIISIASGVIYSYFGVQPKYTSYTTVLLKQENKYLETGGKVNETNLKSFVPTYMELVKSKSVIKDVVDELKLEGLNVDTIKGSIAVKQVENTEMVKITVTHLNSDYAQLIANKLVEVTNKKIKEIYEIENIYIIDEAEVSTNPSNINHKKDIIVFTFIGIVVACGFVLWMDIIKPNKE